MKRSLIRRTHIIKWALGMAITMISCVALNLPGTDTQPPGSQISTNGLIAYLGLDGNLYTVGEQGENEIAITRDAKSNPSGDGMVRLYTHPTWSFDGRKLAFVSLEADKDEFFSRVLVAELSTEDVEVNEIFLSDTESPFYLYWEPKGERVSFLSSATDGDDLLLRFAYLNGENSRVIDTGQPYYWAWAPDGSEIYIHEGGSISANPDARLTLLSVDDNQAQLIPWSPASFRAPAWSPDGENLLAAIQEEDRNTFALLDKNGKLLEKLYDFEATLAFTWSPDGKYIAFLPTTLESRGILGQLLVIPTGSTEIAHKTQESNVIAYFWSPDSNKIVYFIIQEPEINDSEISTESQETISLSLKVLDLVTGQARYLASLRPTSSFLSVLPFYDQYHLSATIWSPDGTKVVYVSEGNDEDAGIWVVDVDGESQPLRVADGVYAFWSWK
jgi:Tol biopolymer transport system component